MVANGGGAFHARQTEVQEVCFGREFVIKRTTPVETERIEEVRIYAIACSGQENAITINFTG